jgi:multidrug efflux pump subunit AcrA (membrane-fusion protein)
MTPRRFHLDSLESQSALLPTDAPARAARWTAWLLLGVFVATLAFVCLVKLPEGVLASFQLEPEGGSQVIQSPLAGEVTAVRVQDGQEVKAGEELIALRSDEIRNWQLRLRQAREDLCALLERAPKLEEAHAADVSSKDAGIAQAGRELSFQQKHLETMKEFLKKGRTLAASNQIPPAELLRLEVEVASAEKELALAEKGKQQANLRRQELAADRARQQTEEAPEAAKLKARIAALEKQLENCDGETLSVRAPYDAIVLSLRQRNPGGMVGAGAELCQLARAGRPLRARLSLPERGVARLQPGQPVQLRFDAFPYERYGSIPAVLDWVSPVAVTEPEGTTFPATGKLGAAPAGSLVKPRLGMRGGAYVLVGRRTLLGKFLEPLRRLKQGNAPESATHSSDL